MKKILITPYVYILFIAHLAAQPNTALRSGARNAGPIVKTLNGFLQGRKERGGILSFKGIPYALPPIHERRWKEPEPMVPWKGVRQSGKFGPRAMQAPIFSDMVFRSDGVSEDCLYLNIWAPAEHNKNLPVLVYFYGGGFIAGDGSEPRYDGESMARQGIVAITVNYRLGLFGFLALPELTNESVHHASGNYGLLDQAMALKWVKQNIKAFGGNPDKITIAGESAGSFSVSAQMASPLSKNLIAAAIGESGSLLGSRRVVSLHQAEQNGLGFATRIGAVSLAALRQINADSLLHAYQSFGPFNFPVCVDGYFFPRTPEEIYEAGEQAHVPLLAGWNSEEMNYRALLGNNKPTIENFTAVVRKLYGDSTEEVVKHYHPESDEEVASIATALAGDRFIAYSTWKWIELQAKTGGKPVYRYLYSHPRPMLKSDNTGNASQETNASRGAVHSAEIEYAMGNLSTNNVFAWDKEDYAISKTMQKYFVQFIKSGNPNTADLPAWPPVEKTSAVQVMHIDVNTHVEPEQHRDRYALMESYKY